MVTGELKNKIDSLWEIFWTGGVTNPLSVIEQMTYLMFIHDLDEVDNRRAREAAMLDLPHRSVFDTKAGRAGELPLRLSSGDTGPGAGRARRADIRQPGR